MLAQWNMEDVKLEIEVTGAEPYVVTTDTLENSDRFISNVSVSAAENGSSNPFGIMGSKSYSFTITDIDDLLSPTNTESPYYDKIKTGTKVRVYLMDTETDEWKPDGTYYITYIGGGFSDGYYDTISISCKDRLDNIGSAANPKIPCYRNIKVEDFLGIILDPLARGTDWDIDSELGQQVLLYGITVGDRKCDTLNALAQFLQARITIDRNNMIMIRSATKIYGQTYTLSSDIIENMSNVYDDSANFSKITINYNVDGYKIVEALLNDNSYTFKNGINQPINNIQFANKALAIHSISVIYDRRMYEAELDITGYTGYQDGIDNFIVTVAGQDVEQCSIYVEGSSIDKSTRKEEKVLYDSGESGIELNVDIKYIIKQSDAAKLINSLAELVNKMTKTITIRTLATPHIDLGDKVVLEDDEFTSTYKGSYRVIEYNTTHGENYCNVLKLIRE